MMGGGLLPSAAGHHSKAGWSSLVIGESHTRHFPKAVCCLLPQCQRLVQLSRIHTFGLIYLESLQILKSFTMRMGFLHHCMHQAALLMGHPSSRTPSRALLSLQLPVLSGRQTQCIFHLLSLLIKKKNREKFRKYSYFPQHASLLLVIVKYQQLCICPGPTDNFSEIQVKLRIISPTL